MHCWVKACPKRTKEEICRIYKNEEEMWNDEKEGLSCIRVKVSTGEIALAAKRDYGWERDW